METGESIDPIQRCLHHLLAEDELAVLLKAHLWVEDGLHRCVAALFPQWSGIQDWKYSRLLDCARAAHLIPDPALKCYTLLNKHRNVVAHHLDAEVSTAMQAEFIASLPRTLRDWFDRNGDPGPVGRQWRNSLYHMVISIHRRADDLTESAPVGING